MKLTVGILILIANLWQQLPAENTLQSIFDFEEPGSGVTTQADPPDDGKVIIIPPPQ